MALKHNGVLRDIRRGHGSERGHDFGSGGINPMNKFDRSPIEPRSADQVRRVKTMGDGSELRTGKLTEPRRPPAASAGPQSRRVK